MSKKWDNDQSNYGVGNKTIYSTKVLKDSLCNFNNACILVWGDITILGRHAVTRVQIKNYASFTMSITKTDSTIINDAEDLDLVMQFELF